MRSGIQRKGSQGFTLIEAMIVIAILAVLASVALPSYKSTVLKSYRHEAMAHVMETGSDLERWFTLNDTYEGFDLEYLKKPDSEELGNRYIFDAELEATKFTITATAKGASLDDICGNLQLDSSNTKTYSKASGSEDHCWGTLATPSPAS